MDWMAKRVKATLNRSGFTFIELLIVVAILATLAAISFPLYRDHTERAQVAVLIANIRTVGETILAFELNNRRLPETLAEAGVDLLDPWGNPLQYIPIRGKPLSGAGKVSPRKDKSLHPLNSDFDLWSMGPDGQTALPLTAKASHDDIIRAADGNFLGIAEHY